MTPLVRELRIVYLPAALAGSLPQVGQPADAAALLRERLECESVEVCLVLLVNTKHRVIGVHELGRGTLDSCLVHPRDVFKAALLANAAGVIVCHYVARHIMTIMCRRSLCGSGQWEPPITRVDTVIAAT